MRHRQLTVWLKERLKALRKFYKISEKLSHTHDKERKMSKKVLSQSQLCRTISDRHDVMAQQVFSAVTASVDESLDREQLAKIKEQINGIVKKHSDGVVSLVLSNY